MDMKQCNDKKEHIRMKTHSGKNRTGTPTPDYRIAHCHET